MKLKGAKMVQVDGEIIKENTWYIIENGEVKELDLLIKAEDALKRMEENI